MNARTMLMLMLVTAVSAHEGIWTLLVSRKRGVGSHGVLSQCEWK